MARLYSVNDDHRCDHQATDNQAARFMAVEVADRLSTDDNDRTIYWPKPIIRCRNHQGDRRDRFVHVDAGAAVEPDDGCYHYDACTDDDNLNDDDLNDDSSSKNVRLGLPGSLAFVAVGHSEQFPKGVRFQTGENARADQAASTSAITANPGAVQATASQAAAVDARADSRLFVPATPTDPRAVQKAPTTTITTTVAWACQETSATAIITSVELGGRRRQLAGLERRIDTQSAT